MAAVGRVVKGAGLLVLLLAVFAAGWLMAKTGMGSKFDPGTLPEVERQFIEKMNGAALVGRFTVSGREDQPARRIATISTASTRSAPTSGASTPRSAKTARHCQSS